VGATLLGFRLVTRGLFLGLQSSCQAGWGGELVNFGLYRSTKVTGPVMSCGGNFQE